MYFNVLCLWFLLNMILSCKKWFVFYHRYKRFPLSAGLRRGTIQVQATWRSQDTDIFLKTVSKLLLAFKMGNWHCKKTIQFSRVMLVQGCCYGECAVPSLLKKTCNTSRAWSKQKLTNTTNTNRQIMPYLNWLFSYWVIYLLPQINIEF